MMNFVKYIIVIAFIVGIGYCFYLMTSGTHTSNEFALLSIVLTIFSVLATWIVTHMYSQSQYKKAIQDVQESHRTNLRTYALKAAEKVNNLSNQLNLLAAYLQDNLDEGPNEHLQEDLLAKQERIGSAIHIIGTLKSVNDTALSDWEGVIGDELEQQREEQTERQEEVGELIDRLETISESQINTQQYAQDRTQELTNQMDALRKDLRSMAISWGLSPVPLVRSPEKKKSRIVTVDLPCPGCGQSVAYSQKQRARSVKAVKCEACGTELISRYNIEHGFVLEERKKFKEQVKCPFCGEESTAEIDRFPSSSLVVDCAKCLSSFTIVRTTSGISIRTDHLTDQIVQLVRENLPAQPWPTGISKSIAEKLRLPNKLVSEAIQKLIAQGIFKVQVRGELYVPLPTPEKKSNKS